MAKLDGVKTLDTVNGEITKVEYNGEVYEKVDTPKKGDIGLFTEDSWVSFLEGIPVFTEIIDVDDVGDPQVSSELGSVWRSKYLTYFRKPSAPSLKAGDKVRLISDNPKYGFGLVRAGDVGEVRHINGDDVVVDFPNHTYWNGVEADLELVGEAQPSELFAKVNRPNNVPIPGDYVEFRDDIAEDCSSFLTVGKKYEVGRVDAFGGAVIADDDGDYETAEPYETKAIYVKYTQEQAEREPKVGDKIIVVDVKTTGGNYGNGDILTVSTVYSEGVFVEEFARGLWNEEFIVLNPEQIREAEEEPEVEEAQAEGVPFEVGQFVVAEDNSNGYTLTIPEAGALEVVEVGEFILGGDIRVKFNREFTDGNGITAHVGEEYSVNSDYFRLATDEEIIEALGLNEIKKGDKVEVLAENHPLLSKGATFTVTDVYENGVKVGTPFVAFVSNGKPRIKLVEEGEKRSESIEKGDLVRVIDSPGALPDGSVFKVTRVDEDGTLYGTTKNKSSATQYIYAPKHVELIAKAVDTYV